MNGETTARGLGAARSNHGDRPSHWRLRNNCADQQCQSSKDSAAEEVSESAAALCHASQCLERIAATVILAQLQASDCAQDVENGQNVPKLTAAGP